MNTLSNRIQLFLSILLFSLVFGSCSNDDEDFKTYSITGEWFGTYSDQSQVVMTTIEFSNNRSYKEWTAYVAKENSFNHTREGSYSNGEKIDIIFSTKYNPTQFHKVWRVIETDKYKLRIFDETDNGEQTYQRVVDTYNMNVGESRVFSINDTDFNATAFHSCDESVATVDDNGEIHAIKRGSTFIQIVSPVGQVALRVKVTDSNNIIDDYSSYLNLPTSNVVKDFGQIYNERTLEKGRKFLSYDIIDDIIKHLDFHYILDEHIYMVYGEFKEEADINAIITDFNIRYTRIESDNNYIHSFYFTRYDKNVFEQYIGVTIDEQRRTIKYQYFPNAYEVFDGMIRLSIDDLAAWFNFDLSTRKEEGFFLALINNALFDAIAINYDESSRIIKSLQLICKEEVTINDISLWYSYHYTRQYHPQFGNIYSSINNFMMSDYYIIFSTDSDSGRNSVNYISHKALYL